MKVLVTGATGFIGRHLCSHLIEEGHSVRAMIRPSTSDRRLGRLADAETIVGDVSVAESLPELVAGTDAIIHLAGVIAAARPGLYDAVNAAGTRNLADAARVHGVDRFIFMSSLAAQGPSSRGQPHREPGGEVPVNDYGRSKLAAERHLEAAHWLSTTVLRPGFVYGPHDPELAAWARLVRLRVLPVVPHFDLSFIHVDDLCAIISALLLSPAKPFGPFFVSDGMPISMSALADLMEQAIGHAPAVRLPLPIGMLRSVAPAIERASRLVGAAPLVARTLRELSGGGWACTPDQLDQALDQPIRRPFPRGLKETLDWYVHNGWI